MKSLVQVARRVLAAITCISCGHTYPGHYWGCVQA